MSKQKHTGAVWMLTPVLVLLLIGSAIVLAGIRPWEKLNQYLNLAFMDTLKTTASTAGLNIREQEISTDLQQTAETGEVIYPEFGEQYAILSCDAISLFVPVFWGSTSELLERGACQATSSVPAGAEGNTVISAHVNTYFSDLQALAEGDRVTLYTTYGRFTYEVTELAVFEKTDKRYVQSSDDTRLTLYTCIPQVLGSSDERFCAVCTPVEQAFYVD